MNCSLETAGSPPSVLFSLLWQSNQWLDPNWAAPANADPGTHCFYGFIGINFFSFQQLDIIEFDCFAAATERRLRHRCHLKFMGSTGNKQISFLIRSLPCIARAIQKYPI